MLIKFILAIFLAVCFQPIICLEAHDESEYVIEEEAFTEKYKQAQRLYADEKLLEALPIFEEVSKAHFKKLKLWATAHMAEIYRIKQLDNQKARSLFREISEQNYDLYLKNVGLFSIAYMDFYEDDKQSYIETFLQVDFDKFHLGEEKQEKLKLTFRIAAKAYKKSKSEAVQTLINKILLMLNPESAWDLAEFLYKRVLSKLEYVPLIISLLNSCLEQNKYVVIQTRAALTLGKIYYFNLKDFDKARDNFNFVFCRITKIKEKFELENEFVEMKEQAQYYLQLIEIKEKKAL